MEQDLKLRQLELLVKKPETKKEDVITVLLALQEQAFVLGNCIKNLNRKMADTTNDQGPSYYRRGSIDVWDFIRDQGLGFQPRKRNQIHMQSRI